MSSLQPLEPTLTAHLFAPMGEELVALLRGLAEEDWERQTVCPKWRVREVAAHLLDTGLRRLSFGRDRARPPAPEAPITGYADLVAHLNRLNADWVRAAERLSPRLLTDLLAWAEPQISRHFEEENPFGEALFAVSWAGEEGSRVWFDMARELTERWLHQQQIRLAVGAPPLSGPGLSEAIFDTFLRVLPHQYREVEAPAGTTVSVRLRGSAARDYVLRRGDEEWTLLRGRLSSAQASLALDEETAWLLLTKGIGPDRARRAADLTGPEALTAPFFRAVAVMA